MVGGLDDAELVVGPAGDDRLGHGRRTELIVGRREHERGDSWTGDLHHRQGRCDRDDAADAVVRSVQCDRRSERVPGREGRTDPTSLELVQRGDHVVPFGDPAVELASEVEAQRREAHTGQVSEEGVDHWVEAVAAELRVGVTDDDAADRIAVGDDQIGVQLDAVGRGEQYRLHAGDGTLAAVGADDQKIPIKMLNDRLLVKLSKEDGDRTSSGGILIPATAQMAKRLVWAEVVALGPNVRSAEMSDQVLFSPDDRYEVEVGGEDYIMLRERDLHAVAAKRIEASTGLYL